MRIELAQERGTPKRERSRMSDRMTHRGLLDVRRHDADLTEARRDLGQRRESGTVNAIIVGDQDSHVTGSVLEVSSARSQPSKIVPARA
jgi:hypothetical protein